MKIVDDLFKDELFRDAAIDQAKNTALEFSVIQSILVAKGICKEEEFEEVRNALKPQFDKLFQSALDKMIEESAGND